MRKALMPLVASLALAGGMTGLLIATNAQAQQAVAGLLTPAPVTAKKPMMLALNQQDQLADEDAAAPPAEGGPDMAAEHGARRAQFCKDMYAHKVGELAFLETKLALTPSQAPLFARWKQVSLDEARAHTQTCADRPARKDRTARPTVLDRLDREEAMLKTRLSDLQAERPSLTALYASLTPDQQSEFGHGGDHRGPMGRMGMMGRGPMGHGPMGRGPDGAPPPPPPAQ